MSQLSASIKSSSSLLDWDIHRLRRCFKGKLLKHVTHSPLIQCKTTFLVTLGFILCSIVTALHSPDTLSICLFFCKFINQGETACRTTYVKGSLICRIMKTEGCFKKSAIKPATLCYVKLAAVGYAELYKTTCGHHHAKIAQ